MLQRIDVRLNAGGLSDALPAPSTGGQEPIETVKSILDEVRVGGDAALVKLTARFDGVEIADPYVSDQEIAAARDKVPGELVEALEVAAERIRAFHEHQLATTASPSTFVDKGGVTIRTEYRPVSAAACYVPGGRAVYPSTVLHTALIAKVAGVKRVVVCVPPGPDGHVPAATLAACALVGVDEVIQVGGAQAIAAVAFGTDRIDPVDVIVGPGNIYVALAKRMVDGRVGVPSAFAGPSEVVVVADKTAPPNLVAMDLLVQAEHGPLGLAWCVTWDDAVADAVDTQVDRLLETAQRRNDIEATLRENGFIVVCRSAEQAAEVVNIVAPEHLQVMVDQPESFVKDVTNAGAIFVGSTTPASLGDYLAGPSHVLPTHRSARFGQALGVRDFLKEIHVVDATEDAMDQLAAPLATLATAEGLICHAQSASRRGHS